MTKKLTMQNGKNSENAVRVARTADILELSQRYVRMVISGERTNEKVMEVYMNLQEGEAQLVEDVAKMVYELPISNEQ